jgi:hypothetical protein
VFFNTFEALALPITGPMEDAGVIKLYEPSPTPCLYVAPVENMESRVPLIPLFLAGNSTPTIPHMFSKRKDSGFPFGCADAAAADGRRGSNIPARIMLYSHIPVHTGTYQYVRNRLFLSRCRGFQMPGSLQCRTSHLDS